jgi:hypothetical protein
MSKRLLKKLAVAGSALPLAIAAASANAAVDVTSITAAITDAGTGMTSVQMAFLGLSTTILAVAIIYRFVSRKAGA